MYLYYSFAYLCALKFDTIEKYEKHQKRSNYRAR